MDALKKWLEVRGDDDCPYMFVVKTKDGSKVRQIGYSAFNDWCINEFSEIVGRRTTPHNFRRSRATNLVCYDHRAWKQHRNFWGTNLLKQLRCM